MLAPQAYLIVPDQLVPATARQVCRAVAAYLSDVFDLPHPILVFVERAPEDEALGDTHLSHAELDVDVFAAITPNAPNTIWLGLGTEAQLARAVAHELGHIAELLGYIAERDDVEEFPRILANAVGTTYTAGIGWIERLLNSSFYLRALAEGRLGADLRGGWSRADYWARLGRTRGLYPVDTGVPGAPLARSSGQRAVTEAPRPQSASDVQLEAASPQRLLFPVPRAPQLPP